MMQDDPVVIVGSARTPMGGFLGELKDLSAPMLGAAAIRGAIDDAGLTPDAVDEVVLGCVLTAGQGQAPARQAAIGAGVPQSVPCSTVNKVCGSGMKAAMIAADGIRAGSAEVIVAGGMESMSNAPYLLDRAREGYRMGHGRAIDHMFLDGLEDAYDKGRLMGTFAEECAKSHQFTREMQDAFAISSIERAQRAGHDGSFANEIVPIQVGTAGKASIITADERPVKARLDRIATLRPAFREHGTVTAANSSPISDGAAALVLVRRSVAERLGATIRARVVAHATHAQAPNLFTTAPVGAIRKLIDKTDWSLRDVDLYEINEAFAVVALAVMRDLAIPHEKVNVHGGALALGHPIGASGARILVTLLAALEEHDLRRGVASLCIGGGEATAMAIERCQ